MMGSRTEDFTSFDFYSSEEQLQEYEDKLKEAERKLVEQQEIIEKLRQEPSGKILVPIDRIHRDPSQVRRYFDPLKLEGLCNSIKRVGILEPLIVKPLPDGTYQLVAGERRYRAACLADLTEVPIEIKGLSDQEALEIALIENLQREDLNPVEETEGFLRLIGLTLEIPKEEVVSLLYRMNNELKGHSNHNVMVSDEALAIQKIFASVGSMEWQSFVTNRLPLLKLPEDILSALQQGKIAYTKAKEIARLKDEQTRSTLLREAIDQDLSLTQIKQRIKSQQSEKEDKPILLKSRLVDVSRRYSQSKAWSNPKKQKRLEKLLADLEMLLAEE